MASSKWKLHKFYSQDPVIRNYLPDTSLLSRDTLQTYLDRFPAVYIKPDTRHGGKGVIRAWKSENGYSYIQVKGEQNDVKTVNDLYREINARAADKRYIVQQEIPLAAIEGRSFDIRSMMMRKPGEKWDFYGYLAKVAGPSYIVTNVGRSQGYVLPVEDALRKSLDLSSRQIEEKKQTLYKLSHKICNRFNDYKASTTQIGIDFAIDKEGNLWIIEVNFDLPPHSGNAFANLPDQTNYRKIKKMKALLRSLRAKKKNPLRKKGR